MIIILPISQCLYCTWYIAERSRFQTANVKENSSQLLSFLLIAGCLCANWWNENNLKVFWTLKGGREGLRHWRNKMGTLCNFSEIRIDNRASIGNNGPEVVFGFIDLLYKREKNRAVNMSKLFAKSSSHLENSSFSYFMQLTKSNLSVKQAGLKLYLTRFVQDKAHVDNSCYLN